jgi:hypothetical protein
MLTKIPCYPTRTRTHIIVACMALHNFIRQSGSRDKDFRRCDSDDNYVPDEAYEDQPECEPTPSYLECPHMNGFRDTIALHILHQGSAVIM